MRAARGAEIAVSAGNERVDGDGFSAARATDDAPGGLVAKHQRRRAALVMPVIRVHVRAADADRLDRDHHLARLRHRIGNGREFDRVRRRVHQGFHVKKSYFAVKPPSTASVWPVT